MKVLFAHDHIFYRFENSHYSNGGLSGDVLSRYTQVFEHLLIISRQIEINEFNEKLTYSSIDNTEFIAVPNFKSLRSLNNYLTARKIIEEAVLKCDCLIARLPSSIGKIAIKYAKEFNKPYLIEVVGCAWDANINHGSILGKIIAPYEFFTNRSFIAEAKYTIYITKEFLQRRYPSKGTSVICPNVNIEIVDSDIIDKRINKIKTPSKIIKFGLIGSLDVDYKGHKTVIKALASIKNKLPEFKIEFLGKGNPDRWRNMIEELGMENQVDFVGSLPNGKEVYTWMDSIDIILQPSIAEAQGRSIIEAMSRGCPIISSRVGGIPELIDSECLITPGDHKDLALKIISMIQNKELQMRHAKRNFQEARQYSKIKIEDIRMGFLLRFKNAINNNHGTVNV